MTSGTAKTRNYCHKIAAALILNVCTFMTIFMALYFNGLWAHSTWRLHNLYFSARFCLFCMHWRLFSSYICIAFVWIETMEKQICIRRSIHGTLYASYCRWNRLHWFADNVRTWQHKLANDIEEFRHFTSSRIALGRSVDFSLSKCFSTIFQR